MPTATRTTVQDATNKLERYATSPESFLSELNQVCERLLDMLLHKSFYQKVVIPGPNTVGYFSLPHPFTSCLGIVGNNYPVEIFSQFQQYQDLGWVYQDATQIVAPGIWDLGEAAVQVDIASVGEAGVLQIGIENAADAGKLVRVYGLDEDGLEVFNPVVAGATGIGTVTVNPTVNTTQQYSAVTDVLTDDVFLGRWTISLVNGSDVFLLGTYDPGDKRPRFRRYASGPYQESVNVVALCRRGHKELVNPTDWVEPGNIAALKLGLLALNCEDGARLDLSKAYWDNAWTILQNEMKSYRGGAKVRFPSGFPGNYRNLVQNPR